jgi:Ni,Fe-hydrogenase III large subunit
MFRLHNGRSCRRADVPRVSADEFRDTLTKAVESRARIAALWAQPADGDQFLLTAAMVIPSAGTIGLIGCEVGRDYPSLTPTIPAASLFERELAEMWGLRPVGHPWLKPVRFQHGCDESAVGPAPRVGVMEFFAVEGEEVHEVAVGPVHAGVIEPGHFRFQCQGETVHHLEISLGYQHRGVERAMRGGPNSRTIHYMETLCGDSTVGHATAYCRGIESLTGAKVPARAQVLRAVAAELERTANHIGDLGAIAGDVGFLPTMSYCGRIRGDVLNATAVLCGNRFGRGQIVPGGVGYDVDEKHIADLLLRIERIERDARSAVELMFETPSVQARLEQTGVVPAETAQQIGLVGLAARACGLGCDIRQELPYGIYRFTQIPLCRWTSGDCFARAYVRWLETQQSLIFIRDQLQTLPDGPTAQHGGGLSPNSLSVSIVEGWRGEICHVVRTDGDGQIDGYKVVDPSFHNWFGLAMALRGQPISDFPLCNKSFNLSYCGHDL